MQREFSGVMAKPWRMVALHVGAWLAFLFQSESVLDWTCYVVIAGCVQTIAVRLRRIMNALRSKS